MSKVDNDGLQLDFKINHQIVALVAKFESRATINRRTDSSQHTQGVAHVRRCDGLEPDAIDGEAARVQLDDFGLCRAW